MNEVLHDLVGQEVSVYSESRQGEYHDVGILESFDAAWIRIRKGDEIFCFSVYNVRLVKAA